MRRGALRPGDLLLLPRLLAWSLLLPIAKRVLPLPVLVRLMHRPRRARERDEALGRRISFLARGVLRLRRGDPNCLEQSLLLYRYLPLAGLDAELAVGFKAAGGGNTPVGHAWVLVEGAPFEASGEALEDYGMLLRFGPDATAVHDAGERAGA